MEAGLSVQEALLCFPAGPMQLDSVDSDLVQL